MFTALFATYWARYHIMHLVLEMLTLRDPTAVQQTAASVSAFCAYTALMALVFYREAATLRRFDY
jgi:hypothetical protein